MTMICDNCGQAGIRWMGPMSNLTHTECPHCGGQNCQREEHPADDEPEVATCGCGATGEVNYDDGTDRRYYCHGSPADVLAMTRQQARRWAFWRGSFSMLFACTFFMLASSLAGAITQ